MLRKSVVTTFEFLQCVRLNIILCGKYSASLYSTLNSFPVFHLLKTLLTITDPLNSQPEWRSGLGANRQSCSSLWCLFRLQWVTTSWYHYNYDSHKTQGNDRFIWFLTACRLLIKDTHNWLLHPSTFCDSIAVFLLFGHFLLIITAVLIQYLHRILHDFQVNNFRDNMEQKP